MKESLEFHSTSIALSNKDQISSVYGQEKYFYNPSQTVDIPLRCVMASTNLKL